MKKITSPKALQAFQAQYESISGLALPMTYLEKSAVFALYRKGQMRAGFVLAEGKSLRTLELFVSEEKRSQIRQDLHVNGQFCEVCCFWIERSIRKSKLSNFLCWLSLAMRVHQMRKPFVIFGTNSYGLAKMYSQPIHSLQVHQDEVKGKKTYIFGGYTKKFLGGILRILFSKMNKASKTRKIESDQALGEALLEDIAISSINIPQVEIAFHF